MEDKNNNKEQSNECKTVTNMVHINPTISIIILNVKGLKAQIKRDCQSGSKVFNHTLLTRNPSKYKKHV